jgi:hypothetical protein
MGRRGGGWKKGIMVFIKIIYNILILKKKLHFSQLVEGKKVYII